MHGREFTRAMGLLLDETTAMVPQLDQAPRPDLVLHDGTPLAVTAPTPRRWEQLLRAGL